jgi:hypothetical protein
MWQTAAPVFGAAALYAAVALVSGGKHLSKGKM